jgi:hypothetical protein
MKQLNLISMRSFSELPPREDGQSPYDYWTLREEELEGLPDSAMKNIALEDIEPPLPQSIIDQLGENRRFFQVDEFTILVD